MRENDMMPMAAAGLMVFSLVLLVGCPPQNPPKTTAAKPVASATPAVPITSATLLNATTVVVHEQLLTMGKDYNILVSGTKVATVSGKDFRVWEGDIFNLKLATGELLASEEEEEHYFIKFNRAATFLDANGNTTGYIAEDRVSDFFSWYYTFHFYDKDRKEIGKSEKLTNSSLGTHAIYDANGKVVYRISKSWRPLGDDKYTITVLDPNTKISIYQAILLVCIEDAIGDAAAAKED